MVFALAAGASALVPENALTAVNASDRYDLKVELVGGPVIAGSTITIPTLVANKAYVQNEVLYYAITLVCKKGYNPATQKQEATMTIAGTGVNVAGYKDLKAYWYKMDAAAWVPYALNAAPNAVYNTLSVDAAQLNGLKAYSYAGVPYDTTVVISGMGLVTSTATAPAITVKIAMAKMTNAVQYIATNPAYRIQKDAANNWFVASATHAVKFTTNATTNKCTYVGFSECTTPYVPAAWTQITKGDYYNAATGAYEYGVWMNVAGTKLSATNAAAVDAIFTFMGFDYALINTNALLEADFIKKTTETNLTATATGNIFADKVTTDTITVVPEVSR